MKFGFTGLQHECKTYTHLYPVLIIFAKAQRLKATFYFLYYGKTAFQIWTVSKLGV